MITLFRRACLTVSLLVIPAATFAIGVTDTLNVSDDAVVTRGEFIRAAVRVLDVSGDQTITLPYKRVPRSLESYVKIAYDNGALDLFGSELLYGKPITRGEAAFVFVTLQNLSPVTSAVSMRDAKPGTPVGNAIQIAVAENWISPLREGLFGANRILGGAAAKTLLGKGESSTVRKAPAPLPDRLSRRKKQSESEVQKQTVKLNLSGSKQISFPKLGILTAIQQLLTNNFYPEEDIDPNNMADRAIEAMVNSLGDPFTVYLKKQNAEALNRSISGKMEGIGATVEQDGDYVRIIAPLVGSPALKAGVKPGDVIIEVDGVSIKGLSLADAVDKIRGPKGTTVKLTVRRNGANMSISVERDTIKIPEVEITWQNKVALVKLYRFGNTTLEELRGALETVQDSNPEGVILDLRNNPGGLLSAAIAVMENFVPAGTVVAQTVSRIETVPVKTVKSPVIGNNVPLVVIINKGSASASEIVAGAMQDLNRGTVVGATSFGKGSVQQVVRFTDGSGLKMTIAKWLTPNGHHIDKKGVVPDIRVDGDDDRPFLDAALKVLRVRR